MAGAPFDGRDPSAGMGVGESFDLETRNWKSSGGHIRPARPHGNWSAPSLAVSRIYFVSFEAARAGTARDPRDIRFNDLRPGRIESSAWNRAGFRGLAESFYRYPADTRLFERSRASSPGLPQPRRSLLMSRLRRDVYRALKFKALPGEPR